MEKQQLLVRQGAKCEEEISIEISRIKEELEDHLLSINESANEIQSLSAEVRHLSNRLQSFESAIRLVLEKLGLNSGQTWKIVPLSPKEKQVFLALYLITESAPSATYKQLSRRTGFNESLVAGYITSMMEKGVPLQKKHVGGVAFVSIEQSFREAQAKQNILGIQTPLSYWLKSEAIQSKHNQEEHGTEGQTLK